MEKEKVYKEVKRHDPVIMQGIEKAPVYKKKGIVQARIADGQEVIQTKLQDGTIETTNTAEPGDYIVRNPGGEAYVVKSETFNKRYSPKEGEQGVYEAKGYCKAINNPYGENIKMMASWGEMQSGDEVCRIADTYDPTTKELGGEPYIIANDAFEDTYGIVEKE